MKKIAITAALEAGSILQKHFGRLKSVEKKFQAGLVTVADRESERRIVHIISRAFPNHSVLGEEGSAIDNKSDYKWVIDPLDGTTNFVHGLQFFCVSIGLEFKKEIILAALYAPLLGEFYLASKNQGAYLYCLPMHDKKKLSIKDLRRPKKLHVSRAVKLSESLMVTGFSYHTTKDKLNREMSNFSKIMSKTKAVRRLGSAALDLCYVGRGIFDGYWEKGLSPWDTAAGILVVSEAGGKVSDYSNKKYNLYGPEIAASNGPIHKQLLNLLS
ncbi:MAG: inositol monophosphatase [Deltaproteobacteria bacterium]|nr:inositol monophosphatase [Deltaproteobacteria bacterium]